MKLLHLIASPRGEESRTLKISKELLAHLGSQNARLEIDEINLFQEKLPPLTAEVATGKYVLLGGRELEGLLRESWRAIEKVIERFLSADVYVLSVPMWNFSIPYVLKHYLDIIVQPRYLFRYTASGPEGLLKGKKVIVVTTRGGDYSEGTGAAGLDFQEPYLKTIFKFVGVEDITFINAQPMDAGGPTRREAAIQEAFEKIKTIRIL